MSEHPSTRNPLDEPPKFGWKTRKKFQPLQDVGLTLWRQSLATLRERILALSQGEAKVACVLVQSIVPEWPRLEALPEPTAISGMEFFGLHGGPSRGARQLFRRSANCEEAVTHSVGELFQGDWQLKILDNGSKIQHGDVIYEPMVGDRPICDAYGEQIRFTDGKPVAIQPGCHRKLILYRNGPPDEPNTLANACLAAAEEGGICLHGLPPEINRIVWRDWLDGFDELDGKSMWLNAMFELAWQAIPGSTLTAEKLAWTGPIEIQVDDLPRLRAHNEPGELTRALAKISDPPAHWFSVLPDLISSSVAVIDILMTIGNDTDSNPSGSDVNQPESIKQPEEAATNQQIIEDLERHTPKLKTESVE